MNIAPPGICWAARFIWERTDPPSFPPSPARPPERVEMRCSSAQFWLTVARGVGGLGEGFKHGEELGRLADEKAVGGEEFDGAHRGVLCLGRTHDLDAWEAPAQEDGWL